MRPSSNSMPSKRAPKRTSPPHAIICSRMVFTTFTSLSVPMCGLPSQRISSGAPACAKICSTSRQRGFLMFAGGLFAVGKRARATLAELHVRFRVQSAAFFEGIDGKPCAHRRLHRAPARWAPRPTSQEPTPRTGPQGPCPPRWTSVTSKPFANAIALTREHGA